MIASGNVLADSHSIERPAAARSAAYAFEAGSPHTIRVASRIEDRLRAWRLVHEEYRKKGYAAADSRGLWYGPHDALPETTTFLVERGGEATAALTLVFDGPHGVPADDVYGDELGCLRRAGRRPCEIISLVHSETCRATTATVLQHLFKLAYVTARHLEYATDFVITVNPHHTAYYRKRLLFDMAGEERSYGKVSGAPAVLLRLDLLTAEDRYRAYYSHLPPEKDFYGFFTSGVDDVQAWLASCRCPLDPASLCRWFPEGLLHCPDGGALAGESCARETGPVCLTPAEMAAAAT